LTLFEFISIHDFMRNVRFLDSKRVMNVLIIK